MSTDATTSQASTHDLHLDPIRCDGRGLCHDIAPDLITLDEWGYPLLPTEALSAPVPPDLIGQARDAVNACPVLALHLQRRRTGGN